MRPDAHDAQTHPDALLLLTYENWKPNFHSLYKKMRLNPSVCQVRQSCILGKTGAPRRENTCRISRAPAFSTRRGIGGLRPRPWPAQQPMVAGSHASPKLGFAVPGGLARPASAKWRPHAGARRPGNPANPCPARPKRLSPVCWPRPGAFIGLKPRRSRFFTNRKWRMTCREP
jgi:hypothetical protein